MHGPHAYVPRLVRRNQNICARTLGSADKPRDVGVRANCVFWFYLASVYGLLVAAALHQNDFASYYLSAGELSRGLDPYYVHLWPVQTWMNAALDANPNPPFTLLLLSPLSALSYPFALVIWVLASLALGLIGLNQSLSCFFSREEAQALFRALSLIYCASFPVLANVGLAQLGGLLFFLLAAGYAAYCAAKHALASFLWGMLIAIKLFPAFLLIYVLLKGQVKLFFGMFAWALFLSALPYFWLGSAPYAHYISLLSKGFGSACFNWNASLYGYMLRAYLDIQALPFFPPLNPGVVTPSLSAPVKLYYFCFFAALSLWLTGFRRLEQGPAHRGFLFTVTLMILLSPYGWLYYFPLLTLPLIYTYLDSVQRHGRMLLWLFVWFLLCVPLALRLPIGVTMLSKLGIYSFHFYGLIGLAYLLATSQHAPTFAGFLHATRPIKWAIYGVVGVTSTMVWLVLMAKNIQSLVSMG